MLGPEVRAILVDAGGVLVQPNPAVIAAALSRFGPAPSAQTVSRAHYAAGIAGETVLGDVLSRAPGTPPQPDGYWRFNAAIALSCGISVQNLTEAVTALFVAYRTPDIHACPVPGSRDGLAALAGAGYSIAVVSNHDGSMADKLARSGICQVGPGAGIPVAAVIDSGTVGISKPDPRIFLLALEKLGLDAAEAIHVGDTAPDIVGARAAGIRPVHFDPFADCPQSIDHAHIRSLHELLAGRG